jgi:Mlc titration factor MtfA (ptsG expression regulator)
MTPILIISVALAYIAWLIGAPYLAGRRRQAIRARPFPAAWCQILDQRVPYLRTLPADLQQRLQQHIQVFLAEVAFEGCDGSSVTDEMRLTIAAQACLLILGRPDGRYPRLHQILVYPVQFVVHRTLSDGTGAVHSVRQELAGESRVEGQVVLSWHDALLSATVPTNGLNVVIHEFAHQLDQAMGSADSARRSQVFWDEFRVLNRCVEHGEPSLLRHYGATNPGEFFAVASEVFFEQARRMATEHTALYLELKAFYRLDPLSFS